MYFLLLLRLTVYPAADFLMTARHSKRTQ